jgi:hypothetical protein
MPYRSASGTFTLHDDAAVREKLTVMSKWEAMMDDARNRDGDDVGDRVEALLVPGRTYRVTVEEVTNAPAEGPQD